MRKRLLLCLLFPLLVLMLCKHSTAADVYPITPATRPEIEGKELDWIDGDFVIRNDQVFAIIARPLPTRDANMTVRYNGAGIVDLTRLDAPSDQLSAFYPTADRFRFADESLMEYGKTDDGVFWKCISSSTTDPALEGLTAMVEYRLRDGDPFVTINLSINATETDGVPRIGPAHAVRADRTFDFGTLSLNDQPVAYCADDFFRQTYLFSCQNQGASTVAWADGRMRQLSFGGQSEQDVLACRIYPAASIVDGAGLIRGAKPQTIRVDGSVGTQPRIRLEILSADGDQLNGLSVPEETSWFADDTGYSVVHLPAGEYQVKASAIGHQPVEKTIFVSDQPAEHRLQLGPAATLAANVVDQNGQPIPFKLTIYGTDGTANPNFGPDSADGSIGNCVYVPSGSVLRSLPTGEYECVFSHGPEHDAVVRTISLTGTGRAEASLDVVLPRVVDTSGWISAELHSHSSPSGDNTSSQLGRVQNLVCENLEFAPCTEHQRIDSYDQHLEAIGMQAQMATCSGIELTGSPLPINHQNAFPMHRHPHQQHGGGPLPDSNPEVQIQRLAMWDDGAEKVVQINHPNLEQMKRDRDLDGKQDQGFSKMFDFVDIIEVHPPQDIFIDLSTLSEQDAKNNRMYQWMDLIKEGRFIPGVVNTDAHYNLHGSGWLRNWVRSSTDDPAKIDIHEMTHRLEDGQVIMSTGPFMSVQLLADQLEQPAEVGQHVTLNQPDCELQVTVQCPNWLDVNRVDVFINGERQPELSCSRREQPEFFSNNVVRFKRSMSLELAGDSSIIVAAIGEGLTLGRVMGEEFGKLPPVVVSNPIFVKMDY